MKSKKNNDNIIEEIEKEPEVEKIIKKKQTKATEIKNKIIRIWRKDKLRFWLLVVDLVMLLFFFLFVFSQILTLIVNIFWKNY